MGCNISRPTRRPPTPLIYHDTEQDLPLKEYRTNCPNCCAVITGPICEYCGTRFPELEQYYQIMRTTDNQEIVIPVCVGGEQVDEVIRKQRDAFTTFWRVAHDIGITLQ